jgi:hypothetical protein
MLASPIPGRSRDPQRLLVVLVSELRPSCQPAALPQPTEARGFRGCGHRSLAPLPTLAGVLERVEIPASSVEDVEGELIPASMLPSSALCSIAESPLVEPLRFAEG